MLNRGMPGHTVGIHVQNYYNLMIKPTFFNAFLRIGCNNLSYLINLCKLSGVMTTDNDSQPVGGEYFSANSSRLSPEGKY